MDHWIDSPEVAASQEELIGLRSPVDTRPRRREGAAASRQGPPPSLVQLRIAVWTGDARDTRPDPDMEPAILSTLWPPNRCAPGGVIPRRSPLQTEGARRGGNGALARRLAALEPLPHSRGRGKHALQGRRRGQSTSCRMAKAGRHSRKSTSRHAQHSSPISFRSFAMVVCSTESPIAH